MTKYIVFLSTLAVLTGCLRQEKELELHKGTTDMVSVNIYISPASEYSEDFKPESKSTVAKEWDDSRIKSLTLAVYVDNMLYDSQLVDDTMTNIKLPGNKEASFYAFANMTGASTEIAIPKAESQIQNLHIENISLKDLEGCPLVGHTKATIRENMSIKLIMTRLVSRINFSIDKSMLSNLQVTEVSLQQAPTDIHPFMHESAASAVSDKGDYSSATDIELLNSGGSISLYMLENCQGVLLPDNKDPWQKIPSNIGDKAGLCTYLEVRGNLMADSSILSEVTYRFYLGNDNTGDFNVVRNTDSHITLFATKDGLNASSWRVEVTPLLSLETEITIPDYASQYGCIKIPEVIANGRETMVMIGGESINMGSMTAVSKTIGGLTVEYDPECATNELYFLQELQNCNDIPTTIRITNAQFPEIDTVFQVNPEMPTWKLRTTIDGVVQEYPSEATPEVPEMIICEDGYDHFSFDIMLCDKDDWTIIPKHTFRIPEKLARHHNLTDEAAMTNLFNSYVKPIALGNIDINKQVFNKMPELFCMNTINLKDTLIVGNVKVYGLIATKSTKYLAFYNENLCSLPIYGVNFTNFEQKLKLCQSVYSANIIPAFPSTYELFGDLPSLQHLCTNEILKTSTGDTTNVFRKKIYNTYTKKAVWKIAASNLHYLNYDFKTIYESCKQNFRVYSLKKDLMEIQNDGNEVYITFGHPDYSSDMSNQNYFPFGTYLVQGEVTNPLNNRKIVGTFILTITMYFPLSFQMEKMFSSSTKTTFYLTMVPFSKGYTTKKNTMEWWHRQCLDKIRYSAYSAGDFNSPSFTDWTNVSIHGRLGRGHLFGNDYAHNYYVGYIDKGFLAGDYVSLQSILQEPRRGSEYRKYLLNESKLIYHTLFSEISQRGQKMFSTFAINTFKVKEHDYFCTEIVFDGELIEYKFKDSVNY